MISAACTRLSAGVSATPLSRRICLAGFDVGAFEAHHEWHGDVDILRCCNDAAGDDVALHNAAEDVNQNAFHVGIGQDDFEGGGDLVFVGASTDVEEVGRRAAEALDDVHGRHGKACAVDHASDVAVECDVGQVVLGGFDFLRVFFVQVAELLNVRVLEQRVAIEGDFGVECAEVACLVGDQWVDLHHHLRSFPRTSCRCLLRIRLNCLT